MCCAPAAIIALLTDFVTLADLVSLGTLAVFLLVACALVYRRCVANHVFVGICDATSGKSGARLAWSAEYAL